MTDDELPSSAGQVPKVLLVSSWQTVNIGDVAHSPGALRALQRYFGEAELTLWAKSLGPRERRMFAEHLPEVTVVEQPLGPDGQPGPELLAMFDRSDVLVHGSGPSMMARRELAAWRHHTTKPFGIFGITVDPLLPHYGTLTEVSAMVEAITGSLLAPEDRDLLTAAAFVFCRDSLSARFLRSQGIAHATFGPDATVCFDLQDESAGAAIMQRYELTTGKFLCVVPRLWFTPYHRLRESPPLPEDLRRDAVNAAHEDSDMELLHKVIVQYAARTDHQILVAPEMSYQVELALAHFPGDLPPDVAARLHVLPHFWSLTEAAAVYRRAAAVVSMECHSPLIALAAGVPAIYVRQPSDTIKGQMYRDLGLGDRIFDIGPDTADQVSSRLDEMTTDLPAAQRSTAVIRRGAEAAVQHMVQTASSFIGLTRPPAQLTGSRS